MNSLSERAGSAAAHSDGLCNRMPAGTIEPSVSHA